MSNSIEGARAERDADSGYADLVAEVAALEAAVSDDTPAPVRERIVALRNKVERPPLNQDGNNDHNSPVVARENVDRVRAVARALADEV